MLKEIWAIRIRLQLAGRLRDLALFNLAIDSKLRGCGLSTLLLSPSRPFVSATTGNSPWSTGDEVNRSLQTFVVLRRAVCIAVSGPIAI